MEAAVQRNRTDAQAWYQLGVKQQENEREQKAITALRRALELDPTHLPSWLALAVSHTNEGNRLQTYHAIRQWVDHNKKYRSAVDEFYSVNPEREDMTNAERFESLAQCLMVMARGDVSGEIDADIQIALAVLLNANEVRYAFPSYTSETSSIYPRVPDVISDANNLWFLFIGI